MRYRGQSLLVSIAMLAGSGARADSINTTDILSKTAEATVACLQWMPTGLCLWLDCSLFSCSVQTSLKVGHYIPDLVVSSYNELGANPWTEIRHTLGIAQRSVASGVLGSLLDVSIDSTGNRSEGSVARRDHRNLIFRETDAIGHPQQLFADVSFGLLCPSQAEPFIPYFQSAIDALAWRQEVPEIFYPASVIPGLRELGNWPVNTWGGVYPRTGWTTQAEEPKAAALNAQRAGDIVTRTGQPHLYLPLEEASTDGLQIWPPGPLLEADPRTGTWQMLLPETETTCAVFGVNDLASLAGWGGGRVDVEGDYVWNLWRPYQCCERRGQLFLFSIDWMSYPP